MDCVSRDLGLRIFFVFLITFLSNSLCSLCSVCIIILLNVLCRFPKVFTKRICVTIKSFFSQ